MPKKLWSSSTKRKSMEEPSMLRLLEFVKKEREVPHNNPDNPVPLVFPERVIESTEVTESIEVIEEREEEREVTMAVAEEVVSVDSAVPLVAPDVVLPEPPKKEDPPHNQANPKDLVRVAHPVLVVPSVAVVQEKDSETLVNNKMVAVPVNHALLVNPVPTKGLALLPQLHFLLPIFLSPLMIRDLVVCSKVSVSRVLMLSPNITIAAKVSALLSSTQRMTKRLLLPSSITLKLRAVA